VFRLVEGLGAYIAQRRPRIVPRCSPLAWSWGSRRQAGGAGLGANRLRELAGRRLQPHIEGMHLELSDEETVALALDQYINRDKYPLSARVRILSEILSRLRPEPPRPFPPPPPQKIYGPPSHGRYRRRR